MDINVILGDYTLNCRSAGIIINENKILFQKKIDDMYWALPGGKIKSGESGELAIKRELVEELGIQECYVDKLYSVSENFFEFNNNKFHQYVFSYIINVDKDNYIFEKDEFMGKDCDDLMYKWIDISEIYNALIKPDYLKTLLMNMNDNGIVFISSSEL